MRDRDEDDDALFSGRGPLPEDLARLQRSLSTLPLPPEPDWSARRVRERWPRLVYAAVAAVLIIAFGCTLLARDSWRVDTVDGSLSFGGMAFWGRIALGGRVATEARSHARIEVEGLGRVELGPSSVLRRVPGRFGEQKLALDRGTLHAYIQAPPRRFVVETPVGIATDLGCAYTLYVDRGAGWLTVTTGRVTFTNAGFESFVPAGCQCELRPSGVGVPTRVYASDAFLEAIRSFENDDHRVPWMLDRALATAEASDAITLWHLLPRVSGEQRERVAARIAALIEVPGDVPRARVLALEPAALDAWWAALGMGDAAEWRAGPGRKVLRW